MEHDLFYFSKWLGSWFLVIRITWWFFNKEKEDTLRSEIKTIISNWLRNRKLEKLEKKITNWPMTFAAVFDGIFGKKHFSRRCIIRSCIASFVTVLVLTLFWWMTHPDDFYGILSKTSLYEFILIYLLITIFLNSFADYFSLLETRWIIDRIKDTNSTPNILGFLAIDFVATVSIFLAVMTISLFPIIYIVSFFPENYGSNGYLEMLSHYWGELYYAITLKSEQGNDITVGVWLYSTFFTSIWVWLYFLSGLIVKIIVFFAKLLGWTVRFLDIDNKPLRSIGVVGVVIVSFIFLSTFIYITIKTTEREVIETQAEEIFEPVTKELAKKENKDDSIGGFYINRPKETPEELNKTVDSLKQKKMVEQYSFDDWYKIGASEFDKGEHDNSIASFEKALEKSTNDASTAYTYNYIGTAKYLLGRYKEALADYDKAIEFNLPKYGLAYSNRGSVYLHYKQYEEAFKDFKKAIELEPEYIVPYRFLPIFYITKDDYESALNISTKALSYSFTKEQRKQKAVILYFDCIARKLLGRDTSVSEKEFNEILEKDFTLVFLFNLSESWIKNANISEDAKSFIKEKTEMLKSHLKE